MRTAATVHAAALLDRALTAWDTNDLNAVREVTIFATGGARRDDERLSFETLLACAAVAEGEPATLPIRPDDLCGSEPVTRAHASYLAALYGYLRRDYSSATWWLQRMPAPTGAFQARKLQLEADIAFARDSISDCVSLLTASADILMQEEPCNTAALVKVVHLISVLAANVQIERVFIDAVAKAANDVERPFQASFHRVCGWAHLLRGEHEAARTAFVRENLAAMSLMHRLDAVLDQTTLALIFGLSGDSHVAEVQVDFIDECLRNLDWSNVQDITSLVHAACTLAELGAMEQALRCTAIARQVVAACSPRYTMGHGSIALALIDEAEALAQYPSVGRVAMETATRAYKAFVRLGFEWRAARAAAVMHQISRSRRWEERALQHLSPYPHGTFPQILSLGVLTQREREVVRLVQQGHSVQEISQSLVLGESTVRTHIANAQRKLAVNGRSKSPSEMTRVV